MDEKSRPLDEFTQNAQALTRAKFHKKEDGHMILEPHDFKSIDPATFSALKERYPIYNTLPRGPIPGNLEPLAKGLGPRAFKEQFEDTWASTNLAYAAAVRTYVQLEQLKEDKKPPSKKVLQDAAFAILTISNIQARALQQYKHHCARTVAPHAIKPGTNRSPIAPNSEEKAILAAAQLDTQLTRARQERIRERGRGHTRYTPWQHRTHQYEPRGNTRPFHGPRDNQQYNQQPGRQFGRPYTSYPSHSRDTSRAHN
ncbi:hypothetical protein AAMO2058_001376200 [Amorphochlora amoebiformis]